MGTLRQRTGQSILEYVVILLAVVLGVSWAAGPLRGRVTAHAEAVETAMQYLF